MPWRVAALKHNPTISRHSSQRLTRHKSGQQAAPGSYPAQCLLSGVQLEFIARDKPEPRVGTFAEAACYHNFRRHTLRGKYCEHVSFKRQSGSPPGRR
jgi:hypothetical protein